MSRPEHLSPEQAAALLRVDLADVERLIGRGELRRDPQGIPREDVQRHLVYSAFLPHREAFSTVEGVGATRQHLPDEVCVECLERGHVHYVGTEVLEGVLELSHLIHVEVKHHFACADCGAAWGRLQFL